MAFIIMLLLGLVAYATYIVLYRLFFSPLAKFPGPALAAASRWYEAYFEIVKQGRYTFEIDKMHEKYGPIVRVTPNELHIKDSSFWDTLFRNPKANRNEEDAGRFGNAGNVFSTSDAELHRVRRGALNNMFSRRAMLGFESVVQEKVTILCDGIDQSRRNGTVCNMGDAFAAYSGDVITQYSFGFTYGHLESEGFKENLHSAFMSVSAFGHTTVQFPWIVPLLKALPDSWVQSMDPSLEKLLVLQRDLRKTIGNITREQEGGLNMPEHPTIFHTLLSSSLPASEKSKDRLGDEAQTVLGAGIVTTAGALAVGTYHLLADAGRRATLQKELQEAIPNLEAAGAFDYQKLERLPYLGACARESIRLSLGVSGRNTRVLPFPLVYGSWTIPPNVVVGMSIPNVHFDESVYKDARNFVPERWLGDCPKAANGAPLEKYFVAFGKGPRSCLGINLAYMEVYIAFAAVFRRFSLALYETDASDVEFAHDFFIPTARLDSKGVRVKVLGDRT